MQAWIPVVSWSLYFWTSVFSFRADSILKSGGDFISNWKCPDCVHFFGAWARQAVIETIAVVYEHTKRTQEMCSPIGHNNTMHFLCPIRSRHPLEFLEMVRWESVPRGSFVLTWKLSSRLFSRLTDCLWVSEDALGQDWVRCTNDDLTRLKKLLRLHARTLTYALTYSSWPKLLSSASQ